MRRKILFILVPKFWWSYIFTQWKDLYFDVGILLMYKLILENELVILENITN